MIAIDDEGVVGHVDLVAAGPAQHMLLKVIAKLVVIVSRLKVNYGPCILYHEKHGHDRELTIVVLANIAMQHTLKEPRAINDNTEWQQDEKEQRGSSNSEMQCVPRVHGFKIR